jgi:hypothetical protein
MTKRKEPGIKEREEATVKEEEGIKKVEGGNREGGL